MTRTAFWTICTFAAIASAVGQDERIVTTQDLVGRSREDYITTPVNQLLTPYGRQVELAGLRPQALALAPDGKRLLVSGKTSELLVVDIESGEVLQRVALPGEEQTQPPTAESPKILNPDRKGQVSFTGLVLSHD
jgi:hypothetical protein